jgi:hypothetical protein
VQPPPPRRSDTLDLDQQDDMALQQALERIRMGDPYAP